MNFQISEKRGFENPWPSHRICRKSLGQVQICDADFTKNEHPRLWQNVWEVACLHVQYTRTASDRLGYATVRLTGSPIARDLEKYAEVFTEAVECWRIDSTNKHLFYLFCFVHKIFYRKK